MTEGAPTAESSTSLVPLALGRDGTRFVLRFAAIAFALFAVYCFPYELLGVKGDWLEGYLALYARLAGFVLHLVDAGVTVVGRTIYGRFSLEIIRSCDAIEVNILFASAVLAYPGSPARKALALSLGLSALVLVNLLRITSLYYVGLCCVTWFETVHLELWPLGMVAAAALSFVLCARWLGSEAETKLGAPAA
jgi:exosortase/archaeosortase family protein